MKVRILFFPVLILVFAGCCNTKTHVKDAPPFQSTSVSAATLVAPKEGETFRCGDPVQISLKFHQDSLSQFDSALVFSRAEDRQVFYSGFEELQWKSDKARVGKNVLKVSLYRNGRKEVHNVNLTLLSDIIPAEYHYRVVQQFPHDENAWTQGLFYDQGILYESTGIEGKSSLRIVSLKTGIPVRMIDLDKQFFGEGIALFRDQVYQITWKSQVGFIYDKETLGLIRRFDYPIKEGWGLTTGSNQLIMSDGSAHLYFLEPEYLTQEDQVEVFDYKGMVTYLNELEYIHGKVLANIWYKSVIVIIDPSTGKVTGQIDLEKLVPAEFKEDSNKVLNGIAYNPGNRHIYITGKYWPVLYELEITPEI
jgi:glutamine cyclotransferase